MCIRDSIYGGYFNGGLGILLLALFGLLGQTNLNAMNGMKNVVSALLTAIAVAVYAWGGVVAWPQALVMMIAATAGGYFGARIARRISALVLRAGIVATGLIMTTPVSYTHLDVYKRQVLDIADELRPLRRQVMQRLAQQAVGHHGVQMGEQHRLDPRQYRTCLRLA